MIPLSQRKMCVIGPLWTLFSLIWALPIVTLTLAAAAWGGVNLAMALYLIAAIGGFFGLFTGLYPLTSMKRALAWITALSAAAIACLGVICIYRFLWNRDPKVPLGDPYYLERSMRLS